MCPVCRYRSNATPLGIVTRFQGAGAFRSRSAGRTPRRALAQSSLGSLNGPAAIVRTAWGYSRDSVRTYWEGHYYRKVPPTGCGCNSLQARRPTTTSPPACQPASQPCQPTMLHAYKGFTRAVHSTFVPSLRQTWTKNTLCRQTGRISMLHSTYRPRQA